eukprot:3074224-Alexandrium_andersonii.AAC.1
MRLACGARHSHMSVVCGVGRGRALQSPDAACLFKAVLPLKHRSRGNACPEVRCGPSCILLSDAMCG